MNWVGQNREGDSHGEAGGGSWLLTPEIAKQLDAGFSETHWFEMQAQRIRKEEATFQVISPSDSRRVRSLTDFDGREFSVCGGERTTTDQPDEAAARVMCFGGSTTFCIEVSNYHTWASYLQRLINARAGTLFRVHNRGIPGVPGLDRIAAFRYLTELRRGDIAVFLFGDNDAGWIQWYPNPGLVQHRLPRLLKKLDFESKRGIQIAGWLYAELAPIALRRIARRTARETIEAAEEATKWAKAGGVSVFFFLQPNLFTLSKRNARDQAIYRDTAQHLKVMITTAYECYREWMDINSNVISATNLFDNEKSSPYMGDWAHVSTRGNQLLAEFIFNELQERKVFN